MFRETVSAYLQVAQAKCFDLKRGWTSRDSVPFIPILWDSPFPVKFQRKNSHFLREKFFLNVVLILFRMILHYGRGSMT